jgi:hypothetical protein
MIRLPKSAVSLSAVVVAAGVLTLAAPRAAHAVAAALVQVTNTSSNPVVAQSTSTMASQLVELFNYTISTAANATVVPFNSVAPDGAYAPNYVVPANQSLVITSADLTFYGCLSALIGPATANLTLNGYFRAAWNVSGQSTTQFIYPSGLVLPGGSAVGFSDNSPCALTVDLKGYLTSN